MEDRFNTGRTVYRDAKGREITEAEYLKYSQPKPAAEPDERPVSRVKAEKEVMSHD